METMRARAKGQLPSVLLTLLSIIQALALELLWGRIGESAYLFDGGWPAVVGWTQVAAVMLGLLQVWFTYTSLVMRFAWTPSLNDLLVPFAVGVLEFTMIELMGQSWLGGWFVAMAATFALVTWASHQSYVHARREPENAEFFSSITPASWRDFTDAFALIGAFLAIGLLLWATDNPTWLAMLALLGVNAGLLYQIDVTRRFWQRTMSAANSTNPSE